MAERKLTKSDILEGTARRETLHLKEYDAHVVVRPLTDGELSKVFGTIGSIAVREDGSPDVETMDISKNLEALRTAASIGLVDPILNIEDISKMKFGVPEFIGMKVLEFSGVSFTEEDLRKKGEKSPS
ncbi:MAG: hypothetical protein AUJ07_03760 [Crenarchaeota archaeon 13_1_40CM_3_53_5]|nr:MAG: hypothetical protein AUJ07_03760 [Crenarchaeota archaeon 13_1_40CM_3_53_5]